VILLGFASWSEVVHLPHKPGPTHAQLGSHSPDRPALPHHAGVQVAGEVGEAELGKARLALRLPHPRLR